MQMRSADQPGRRVVRADVGEQQQRQQPACPGPHVDPVPARAVIAPLDVIAGIGPVLRREPDHYRAAGIDLRHPPARADQLVIGSGQDRGRGRRVQQPAAQAVDVHQRRPGHGVVLADAPLAQRRPDHLPAGRRRARIERTADSGIAITDEALYVKVHRPILGLPQPQVISITTPGPAADLASRIALSLKCAIGLVIPFCRQWDEPDVPGSDLGDIG
jgi:hypothetical protein